MAKKKSSSPAWARVVAIVLVVGLVLSSLIAIGVSGPSTDDTNIVIEQLDVNPDASEQDDEDLTDPQLEGGESDTQPETVELEAAVGE